MNSFSMIDSFTITDRIVERIVWEYRPWYLFWQFWKPYLTIIFYVRYKDLTIYY